MKAIFRTDASHQIGTGHVMRCLTLAHALREQGVDCFFICREHPGHLLGLIREQGFEAVALPFDSRECDYPVHASESKPEFKSEFSPEFNPELGPELGPEPTLAHTDWLGTDWRTDAVATRDALGEMIADWLIVDHYALDTRWETALRPHCRKLLAIDDLADREHDCDLLLDQNLVADMEHRYDNKLPDHCGLLLGPQYALLQPEYPELHARTPPREGPICRILVYFGGADTDNFTGLAIAAFRSLPHDDIRLDVVINPASLHADAIREQVKGIQEVTLHTHLPSLAPLMVQADLAIGAGGATSWERCCLGLPTLVVTLAENQKPIAAELDRQGLIRWLGHKDEVTEHGLVHALADIVDKDLTQEWSEKCQRLVDGRGTQRVSGLLLLSSKTPLCARLARLDDEALILRWANDPLVRKNAFKTDTIDPNTHRAWFRKRLRDLENCRIYVVETEEGLPVGQVRFERNQAEWEVHYALDSGCRGRGMGVPMLTTALGAFRLFHPSGTIFGRVKPENNASRKVLRLVGFSEDSSHHELIYRHSSG